MLAGTRESTARQIRAGVAIAAGTARAPRRVPRAVLRATAMVSFVAVVVAAMLSGGGIATAAPTTSTGCEFPNTDYQHVVFIQFDNRTCRGITRTCRPTSSRFRR